MKPKSAGTRESKMPPRRGFTLINKYNTSMQSDRTMKTLSSIAAATILLAADSQSFTTPSSHSSRAASATPSPNKQFSTLVDNTVSSRSAASYDEDLEMTRQIIMEHVKKMGIQESGVEVDEDSLPSHNKNPDDYPLNDLMIRAALGR